MKETGGKGCTCPLKFGKKYFSGNYYVTFKHFLGKNHVKFRNFVNYLEKYYKKNRYFANFSGKNYYVKFGHFVNVSYIFFGQKLLCPPKLTERLCL